MQTQIKIAEGWSLPELGLTQVRSFVLPFSRTDREPLLLGLTALVSR